MKQTTKSPHSLSPLGRHRSPMIVSTMVALLGALSSGCAPKGGVPDHENPSGTVAVDVANATTGAVTQDLKTLSSSMHHFMVGELALDNEDFDLALDNLKRSSELTTEPAPLLHNKLAELQLRFGHLDEALQSAALSMKEDPADPYSRLLYAGILEGLDRQAEAEPIYQALIKEFPDKFDSYVLLANIYSKSKRYDAALVVLDDLLKRAPNEGLGHYYKGQTYEQMEKFDLAEIEFTKVFEGDPNHITGSAELLRTQLRLKKFDAAKAICNRILEKDPKNALARKVLGHLMLGESKLDEALEHLQVLEKVEEDSSDTRFKIGLIQIEKQNLKEAERELNLVLAKNPKHSEARYYLASLYAGSDRRRDAVEELLKIEKSSSMFVKSRTFAAFILRQERDLKRAEQVINEALTVDPNDQNLILYLVLVLRDIGKADSAERVLREALTRDPKSDRLLFNLALVVHDQGRESETLSLMEKLLEMNPTYSDALNYVAYALVESGKDLERARTLASKALEIRPNDGYYLDTLGWAQFKLGNIKEAEETLARSVSATGDDIVIAEHYIEVLIVAKKLESAVVLMRGFLEQKFGDDSADREKKEAQERIRQRLDTLVRDRPELEKVQRKTGVMSQRPDIAATPAATAVPVP